MRSQILLCVLVGLAYANKNPGWKPNTEYIYQIRGRTLASLHEHSNQYSGVVLKAQLHITPKVDGVLHAKISDAQYAQIHTELPQGWQSEIQDSQASYKPLPISQKPFQMVMQEGVILDIIVEKDVQNWEANFIKSIAGQFQLDTKAMNLIPSNVNQLPTSGQNDGVYKTMEETVTGNTETLYEIHPLPEYILQSQPWLAPQVHLKEDGEVIEVVKHKNYSRSEDRPAYHYGFASMEHWEPSGNQISEFFVRSAISRAVLTGNLNRYTIQNSYTVNEVIMSPALYGHQKGSVVSLLNVTLSSVPQPTEKPQELTYPKSLQSLVYSYSSPFESASEARERKPYDARFYKDESNEAMSASEEQYQERYRMQNSLGKYRSYQKNWDNPRESSSSEDYYQIQRSLPMDKAPESPFLPYTMGSYGNSLKNGDKIDVEQNVQRLAREISQDVQQPDKLLQNNGLNKFTILTSLIRIMDADEIQKNGEKLYSQQQEGSERTTWLIYRDAVAQAGTGPAALTIQNWIQSKKEEGEEAAQLVSTMAYSVRQPTEEYMKKFFEFVKKPEVQEQHVLNQVATLAYTNLLRRVYVNKYQSHNQFPVHSFGSFYSKEGREYLKNTVIPYLAQKLHESITAADTYKIHLYIRALGNVAHQKILEAFEPYLEGTKQASQFQRLMMVFCLRHLAETNPIVARSVLLKIYQNSGETPEIRSAAVYQLMRTHPPTDILQRMASYTNIDTQEQVNAAVKSVIESAAELEGEDVRRLRLSAQAAKPLLTKKLYGIQHGYEYLRSYVVKELNSYYKASFVGIGNDGSYAPKGLRYSLRAAFGGLKRHIFETEAVLSCIDELAEVVLRQTQFYKESKQQKNSNQHHQYSSENIAKLLNLKSEEHEQLEGIMHMKVGAIEHLFSFDNHTIEQLPQVIRQMEQLLKRGKSLSYMKLMNQGEIALAFPTETGFPFLFTYDTPALLDLQGQIEMSASPSISQNGKLHVPERVLSKFNGHLTVSLKTQSRLTFITPFDRQQYIAGFDKNMQLHIPAHGKTELDLKQGYVKKEYELQESHNDAPLFHYSTWPYTSRVNIADLKPVMVAQDTHSISKKEVREFNKVVTLPSTGIALQVQYKHESAFVNLYKLGHMVAKHGIVSAIMDAWDDASVQQSILDIRPALQQSSTKKIVVQMSFQQKYRTDPQREQNEKELSLKELSGLPSEMAARQEEFMSRVGSGIKSAHLYYLDTSVEFQGASQYKYRATAAVGKSRVHPKSRVLFYFKRESAGSDTKQWQSALRITSDVSNPNGLDAKFAMEQEPKMTSRIEHACGADDQSSSKVNADVRLYRSQERKQYLKELPVYAECEREMQEGNKQLPACLNVTIRANFFDRVEADVKYENLHSEDARRIRTIYDLIRVYYLPSLEEEYASGTKESNKLTFEARFHPDFRGVNVSLKTQEMETKIKDIEVNDCVRPIVAVHPVFHLFSRVESNFVRLETLRQFCVVDQSYVNTLDNRTYHIGSLDDKWTVAMQYVPKQASMDSQHQLRSVEEQLKEQIENYVVLVRESPQKTQHKEVKIIVQAPETKQKIYEIALTPAQSKYLGKVQVDGQEVTISDKKSHDVESDFIQIYAIDNGEIKVEVKDKFYVLYDGKRLRLSPQSQWRDAARGICGTHNDDKNDDFLTADNCVARDVQDFIESYKVGGSRRGSKDAKQCQEKVLPLYVDVISDQDSGREDQLTRSGSCTTLQTRYVEQGGEICFTIRPMPVCNCKQRGSVTKNIPVHCVQKSNASNLWKDQITKGGSPDFSGKTASKSIQMQLPQGCSK